MSTTKPIMSRLRAMTETIGYRLLMTRCRRCGWWHPTLLGHIYGLEGRLTHIGRHHH